jgi:tellurite resistance protein
MTIAIKTRTIERLRDDLRESGRRPSVVLSSAYETLTRAGLLSPEEQAALTRIEPLAEVMFLMMAADGTLAEDEREVLRGAVRGLSDDGIRTGTVNVMLERFEAELTRHGAEARLDELARDLHGDAASAEGAFILAAAVAFADGDVTDAEDALINDLAETFGIDEQRANQLLDRLDED